MASPAPGHPGAHVSRELGCEPDYYIPHRLNEGYGLYSEALGGIGPPWARVVVSVDCGMTALAEAERACELGLDLIITDHHTPAESLPRCFSVINPKQDGCNYPFKGLSGRGWRLSSRACMPCSRRTTPMRFACNFRKSLLDLATPCTVADIVPLVGENRALVSHGLGLLREGAALAWRRF